MNEMYLGFAEAYRLISTFDPQVLAIAWLSIKVSGTAVFLATALGLPLGAWLAITKFPGRQAAIVVLNGLMGLPPVVVGLIVYLILSRAGPLGSLGILFTPTAMIVAQALLIFPIITALTRQVTEDAWDEYREQLLSLNANRWVCVHALLWDMRYPLLTAVLAGFGRATAEVGAVMIVGGNIDGVTRVMTTAIALETSKGDLALALALGIILLVLVIGVNALAQGIKVSAIRRLGH